MLPAEPRAYSTRSKLAQEAHEAIRPTSVYREPEALRPHLDPDQYRLYDLIWKRFVASQMASAVFDVTTVDVDAQAPEQAEVPLPRQRLGASSSPASSACTAPAATTTKPSTRSASRCPS